MAHSDPHGLILGTKLYRPPVTEDYTPRISLEAKLDAGFALPLTLVCAPAGYGKSTSISRWLETNGRPHAWLSLDDSDSDLRRFLGYVVAAVQSISAKSCKHTESALQANSLPDKSVILVHLCNDLEALDERIILVLDDFHRISDPEIHHILDGLLAHPLLNLHLVIISRRDPILSLATLRARHLLNEFRLRDLKFSFQETGAFVSAATKQSVTSTVVEKLQTNTEGWPAGLRLATLALRNLEDVDSFLTRFGADTLPLQEYLIGEVLSSLPPAMCEKLVHTAILERFNASLCEAIWENDFSAETGANEGKKFISSLRSDEVFCIALDEEQEWYRLHHLFQGLLGRQLVDSIGSKKVAKLHQRAAHWFCEHNYFEEAIHHAINGENPGLAVEVIVQGRQQLMNTDQWHRLAAWLKVIPPKIVLQQPQLLLAQCWLDLYHTYRLDLMALNIQRVEELLQYSVADTPKLVEMRAELNCLQAVNAYSICNSSDSAALSRQSLRDSPIEQECVRSSACWIQIMNDQMRGELNEAEAMMWSTLSSGELKTAPARARLWIGACYSAWCEADLEKFRESVTHLHKISNENHLDTALSYTHYFLGLLHYEANELTEAIAQFEVAADNPNQFSPARVVDCTIQLILCYQALGKQKQALKYLDQLCAYVLEPNASWFQGFTQALRAEFDLRQGRVSKANQWANNFTLPPEHSMQRAFYPEFAAARILLAQNTSESLGSAGQLLEYLNNFSKKIHHRRFLIEVLNLKATLAFLESDESAAVTLLSEAFELGKTGRLIRPFVELEAKLLPLLNRLDLDAEGMEYLGTILAALPGTGSEALSDKANTVEVLSQRELEILELLAQDHSNKAIAEKLFISMGTVKRHAHNIFSKLGVNGRRAAVSKGKGLGILKK
jgi:LuxR family maltose regulon positive regulatory protein